MNKTFHLYEYVLLFIGAVQLNQKFLFMMVKG